MDYSLIASYSLIYVLIYEDLFVIVIAFMPQHILFHILNFSHPDSVLLFSFMTNGAMLYVMAKHMR